MPDPADQRFMHRALDLAAEGLGLASPNPCVGAVLVDACGAIAGTGTYTYDGLKHAEILALEQAGSRARGGTLYINLEPCSHSGRTPPCADALIAAGIRRIVASMVDPNPIVSGRGFDKLRQAGVQVEIGEMAEQARRLNETFARYIRHGLPFVTLKSAMTLNGKIAPAPSPSNQEWSDRPPANRAVGGPSGGWITGEAARAHVQTLRHEHDALMVGIGTVLADNPLLTDRSGLPRRRPLLRVVLDSRLRLPLDSRLVDSVANGDVLVFCSEQSAKQGARLEDRGIRVETAATDSDGRLDLRHVTQRLGQLEITSLLVEGGATVNGFLLTAGLVDKAFLFYAPKFFTRTNAVPFAVDMDRSGASETIRLKSMLFHRFEDDFAVEGYFRDPYQD